MKFPDVGTKVEILMDCRKGGTASGKTAVYEGNFPRSVIYVVGDIFEEYNLSEWENSPLASVVPERSTIVAPPEPAPAIGDYPDPPGAEPFSTWWAAYNHWLHRHSISYYYKRSVPRFAVEGISIWGDECYWRWANGGKHDYFQSL